MVTNPLSSIFLNICVGVVAIALPMRKTPVSSLPFATGKSRRFTPGKSRRFAARESRQAAAGKSRRFAAGRSRRFAAGKSWQFATSKAQRFAGGKSRQLVAVAFWRCAHRSTPTNVRVKFPNSEVMTSVNVPFRKEPRPLNKAKKTKMQSHDRHQHLTTHACSGTYFNP